MKLERGALGPALLLVIAAVLAWSSYLRAPLGHEASSLGRLPLEIDGWRGIELPIESSVENMLRADFNLFRAYHHVADATVWLYVGYYGTERGGAPEHTPWVCYPANGWRIESRERIQLDPGLGLRANELTVSTPGERRLVHFWYRSFRRTGLLGKLDVFLDHLLGRLGSGRADGALVRLSTDLEPGREHEARLRLRAFAVSLEPLLARHWPEETALGGRSGPAGYSRYAQRGSAVSSSTQARPRSS